jgi:hypothetical protein
VNLANGRSLFDESKQGLLTIQNRKHLLVSKVRIGVIALPLYGRGEPSSVAASGEQIDPNKRRGSIHVAKDDLLEMIECLFFQVACGGMFFNP